VTKPAQTIADLRGVVSSRELRRAIRQANVLGLPIGPETGRDRTRSDLERDFLRICRRYRLPAPEVNVRVGPHLVDFLWRSPHLVVETDGYRYHRGRQAFRDDRARDLDLRERGFEVLHLSEELIEDEPEKVAGVLRARITRQPAA
jgi:very-short-patch-repair endonuclease